jgi:hypothetical protein
MYSEVKSLAPASESPVPQCDIERKSRVGQHDGSHFPLFNIAEAPHGSNYNSVLADRQERKVYDIDQWRSGFAPDLILSVGRFEWRSFYTPDLQERKITTVPSLPLLEAAFRIATTFDRTVYDSLHVARGIIPIPVRAITLPDP